MDIFGDLETPCVVVDMCIVRANLKSMADFVRSRGCALRPHVKTHKIPELARLALEYGACGVTCAKISEAEVMAEGGISDIFIAYPLVGDFRVRRAAALAKKIRLILAVDGIAGARALSDAAVREGMTLEVRLEVDTGLRRTGVFMAEASALAHAVAGLPGLRLTGIFTFRGLVLDGKPTADNAAAGRQEGEMLAGLAERLRGEGLDIPDVSGGSSPTGRYVAEVPGVTEVRPGTYIFNDCMQVAENACAVGDCAATVLATVVSAPAADYAVIDGGSKTFATDFPLNAPPFFHKGYAVAADDPNLMLTRVNEEHGILTSSAGPTGFSVGQRVRLIPVHICTTVNLHDAVWFLEEGALRRVRVAARGMLV
jgi:D-serine deaminase-like pyridoxal phosphate-dependent protein